jgi:hypothetical protein
MIMLFDLIAVTISQFYLPKNAIDLTVHSENLHTSIPLSKNKCQVRVLQWYQIEYTGMGYNKCFTLGVRNQAKNNL